MHYLMNNYTTNINKSIYNKRALRALGRSPEDNLNNFGRGTLDDAIYQI